MCSGILLGFLLICQMDMMLGVPIQEIATENNDEVSSNFSESSEEHYHQVTFVEHVGIAPADEIGNTNNGSTTEGEVEFPFTDSSENITEKTTSRIVKPISDVVLASQAMSTFYSVALPTFIGIIFCVGLVCVMLRPKGYCCRKIFSRHPAPLEIQEHVDAKPARRNIF